MPTRKAPPAKKAPARKSPTKKPQARKAQPTDSLSAYIYAVPDGAIGVMARSQKAAHRSVAHYWLLETQGYASKDDVADLVDAIEGEEDEDIVSLGKGSVLGHGIPLGVGLQIVSGAACSIGVAKVTSIHVWPAQDPTPKALAKALENHFTFDGNNDDSIWPAGCFLTIL